MLLPYAGYPRAHVYVAPSSTPTLVGFANSSTGNPTMPAHVAGDLIVAIASNNTTTLPTAVDGGGGGTWLTWDSTTGNNCAIVIAYMIATGTAHTVAWTNAISSRPVWVFRTAQRDVKFVGVAPGSTLVSFPTLSGTALGIYVYYLMTRNSQINISAQVAFGGSYTERVARNTIPAAWVGDTNTNLLNSSSPGNKTLDTSSSGHAIAAFAVKGA